MEHKTSFTQNDLHLQLFSIDAFTSQPFSGNPAAVCLDNGIDESVMQKIATEMNISETAFVRHRDTNKPFNKGDEFSLRWFTPTNEVPLCGHATLATAAVLFNVIGNDSECLTFHTLSGPLLAKRNGQMISLDLPANPPEPFDRTTIEDLLKHAVLELEVHSILYSPCTRKLLIRLNDSQNRGDLEKLTPAVDQFMKAENSGRIGGVILTLKGDGSRNGCVDEDGREYDFISRYFTPWNGIPEDPVTGAAHTVLTPYWSKELGKTAMYARQCSSRGGELHVCMREDGRVDVAGFATLILQGTIRYN